MTDELTIARNFFGPPDSGNGGYVCGVTAARLVDDPAKADGSTIEVTLRLPPPLERPMQIESTESGLALVDDGAVVAEARRSTIEGEPPPAVGFDQAHQGAAVFDVETYDHLHPFGNCFVCGPRRAEGTGLRIFPAPAVDRPGVAAWPWKTYPALADEAGHIRFEFLWSALDCPSCFAHWMAEGMATPIVLGRLTVEIRRRPAIDEHLVVGGWQVGREGRKVFGGSVVWDADGGVVAQGRATWIELRSEQAPAFTGR
jgi:hypothetical protein